MTGIDLSRSFFGDQIFPLLQDNFPGMLPGLSAAILGDGSEVLGFDDLISRDHNYCPRVTILITDDRYAGAGEEVETKLRQMAPGEYLGFPLLATEFRTAIEVAPMRAYFLDHLGTDGFPSTGPEWLRLEEQKLLEMTSGAIFFDPNGKLAALRDSLAFYPDDVRYFLLYRSYVRLSEVGAIERTILRGDLISTDLYRALFIYFAVKAYHFYRRKYCPYKKWMARSLECMGSEGIALKAKIESLVEATDLDQIRDGVRSVLSFLTEPVLRELGIDDSALWIKEDLHLLNFDWDRVLKGLRKRLTSELLRISRVVSPKSLWGMLFDMDGLGARFEQALQENLHFIRGIT